MPSTAELLNAITGMQQNVQSTLPVMPNNGNPQGANNMPASPVQPQPAVGGNKFSWLNPSPSMNWVHSNLAQPFLQGYQGPMPGTQEFKDARAAGETPIRDFLHSQYPDMPQGLPTMPRRADGLGRPSMPPNGGVVGPVAHPSMPTLPYRGQPQ